MLKLRNISKSFPGCFKPTINQVNLELEDGDFCIIVGSNGSGKSTLLKLISGEYKIDIGNILIQGSDVTNKNRNNLIASVLQDVNKGTIPEMTLLENMALTNIKTKKSGFCFYKNFHNEIINEISQLSIGLEDYINTKLMHLSGGQRQMIATIMAISSHPKILLLDEHTSALDPKMQQILMNYTVNAIQENKLTSFMVTHRLDEAIKYGNRLIMIHKGQIVFDVRGNEKSSLTIAKLLELFHVYEDLSLMGGENDL